MTGERYVLTSAGLIFALLAAGCVYVFPPRTHVTPQQLRAYCAVQAFQMSQGRPFATVDSLAKIEHIAVRQSGNRLECVTVGGE